MHLCGGKREKDGVIMRSNLSVAILSCNIEGGT